MSSNPSIPSDQNAVSPSSYQLPPAPPKSHGRRNILIVVGVILIVLLTAAGLYFFTPIGTALQELLFPRAIPQELHAAAFISDSLNGNSILYRFGPPGMTAENAGAVLVSATESKNGFARITRSADGTFKVYLDGQVVLQDTIQRLGIDRAPDGKSLVFAVASSTEPFISPVQAPTLSLDRKSWNVFLYIPSTHTALKLGAGVSPFFLDNTHVVWMAPAGLAIVDLASGTSKILVPDITGRASAAALVSPNHTIFAWYESGSKTLVPYKVSTTNAVALPKTIVPSVRWVTLGNDSFYELAASARDTQILKQAFGAGSVVVGHVPPAPTIQRLLLGSI